MQTRLNTKVPNKNLYHPGPSWHRQELHKSLLAQLRGMFASLGHILLPNPCLVEFEECSDVQATPSTFMVCSSPKLFWWKCPKPVKKMPPETGLTILLHPFTFFSFLCPGALVGSSSPPADTCTHSQAKRGNESFAVGDLDCRILISKKKPHVLPDKISLGSGARLVSYSS